MAASEPLTTAQAVTKAIGLAQEAVKADEAGNIEEAIALYVQSVELIKMGLQIQPEAEVVDNSVLHKYSKLYSDRIDELRKSLAEDGLADLSEVGPADAGPQPFFMYDDVEVRTATPPEAAPSGPDEWRRPFWLMRILRTSMQFGGYLSPDARVFVPRRLWVQKGARFIGLAAKAECAQCLIGELQRVRSVDFRNPPALARELDRLCDTLDALQNSLHRLLPIIAETKGGVTEGNTISKLTDRFKVLAKTLDKTAARMTALPTKCHDPAEYISSVVQLFDAAMVVETWIEHYNAVPRHADGTERVRERLHRCAAFLYEVVCAFVIQDLDGLLQRHMHKAAKELLNGPE